MLLQLELADEGTVDACEDSQLLLAEALLLSKVANQSCEGLSQSVISWTGHPLTVKQHKNTVHGKYATENTHTHFGGAQETSIAGQPRRSHG